MEKLIENRSNYKNLITYQKANTIFCMTYYFCEKYLTKGDRTVDQMDSGSKIRQTEYYRRLRRVRDIRQD